MQVSRWLDLPELLELGEVAPEKYLRAIKLTNTTSHPVTIVRIDSGCSCTVADLRIPCTISPGGHVICNVSLDANRLTGSVQKRVTFHAKTGDTLAAYSCLVKAFVERNAPVLADPPTIDFGRFGKWETPRATFRLYRPYGGQLRLRPINPVSLDLQLEASGSGSEMIAVSASFLSAVRKEGRFTLFQELTTERGSVTVEFRGQSFGDIYCPSTAVVFPPLSYSMERSEKRVRLRHSPLIGAKDISVQADVCTAAILATSVVDPTTTDVQIELSALNGCVPTRGRLSFSSAATETKFSAEYFVRVD